jgi:hypothetical protein
MPEKIEPNWSRAPEGMICWAVDADGRAFYYSADIVAHEVRGIWQFADFAFHPYWSAGVIKLNGTDWRTTKRWKPGHNPG